MQYELSAEFSNNDLASIALNKIQQTMPFSIAEQSHSENAKTSLDAFDMPSTPVFISAVNFPTLIPSGQRDRSSYQIRLIGDRNNCRKAKDLLQEMGAQNVQIHSI